MRIPSAFAVLMLAAACSPSHSTPPPGAAPKAEVRHALYARIPAAIGDFKLTERTAVRGAPSDSLFRFSDGSRTVLSVIIYEVADDVRIDEDSQKWVAREGEKFRTVQEIRRSRGQIADFVFAFSDTARFPAGDRPILEHRIATPVRFRNGAVAVDLQFLYLIDSKFVKVRATIPEQGWRQTRVPSFSRELARRMASS